MRSFVGTLVVAASCVIGLAALEAQAVLLAPRTEVVNGVQIWHGFGGNFTNLGFGKAGYVVAEAAIIPSRMSLPPTSGYEFNMFFWWSFDGPAPADDPRFLVGPGIAPRWSWWLQLETLHCVVVVPRCTRVTFYILDAPTSGDLPLTINAGTAADAPPGGVQTVVIPSYTQGAYVSFNQTVGSLNYTFVKTGAPGATRSLAGVFFDDMPEASCALSRPKTAPFTLPAADGEAELLFNAGGNLTALGFGRRGYYLPANTAPGDMPVTNLPTSDGAYNVAFSTTRNRAATFHLPSDSRLISAPVPGAAPRPLCILGNGGGDLTITVTVPRCSLVRLYIVDLYNNAPQSEVRRPGGRPRVLLNHLVNQGVYVTFRQSDPVASYITSKIVGPNIPLLGVIIDDDPACSTSWESIGPAFLLSGAGGDFRSLGIGAHGFVLGGYALDPTRSNLGSTTATTGFAVSFVPSPPQTSWHGPQWPIPAGYPTSRLLRPPGGASDDATCWFAAPTLTVRVAIPRCTRVTFYFLDYDGRDADGTSRRLLVQQDGAAVARLTSAFDAGVYVTVEQSAASATYAITATAGANAVLSGIFFDPTAVAGCVFVSGGTADPTAPSPSSSSSTDDSTTTIAIVVAVAAVVVLGLVIGGIIFVTTRKRNNGTPDDLPEMRVTRTDDAPPQGVVIGAPVLQCPPPPQQQQQHHPGAYAHHQHRPAAADMTPHDVQPVYNGYAPSQTYGYPPQQSGASCTAGPHRGV